MYTWCFQGFSKDIGKSLTRYTPITCPTWKKTRVSELLYKDHKLPSTLTPWPAATCPFVHPGFLSFLPGSTFVPILGPGDKICFFHLESPFPISIGQISPSHSALTYTVTSSEKAFLNTHSKNPLLPWVPAKAYSLSYLFGWFSSQHLPLLENYFIYSLAYYYLLQ